MLMNSAFMQDEIAPIENILKGFEKNSRKKKWSKSLFQKMPQYFEVIEKAIKTLQNTIILGSYNKHG